MCPRTDCTEKPISAHCRVFAGRRWIVLRRVRTPDCPGDLIADVAGALGEKYVEELDI
jgi:hypothetical protein